MRKLCLALVFFVAVSSTASAQLVVVDVLAIAKHLAAKLLQEQINEWTQKMNESIFIVNRRLVSWSDVKGYFISEDDTPDFKLLDWFNTAAVFFARDFHKTLSYGNDPNGVGFESISVPRDALGEEDIATLRQRVAMLDITDAVITRSADISGALRYAGRAESAAVSALQTDVLDDDNEQAMNAVLSKLTAQQLIELRNGQNTLALETALTELLMLDVARDRTSAIEAVNANLESLRDKGTTPRRFSEGNGSALKMWTIR